MKGWTVQPLKRQREKLGLVDNPDDSKHPLYTPGTSIQLFWVLMKHTKNG
jgi:hypothetical protein